MAIGVVASAEPVGVMPWHLSRAFRRTRTPRVRANYYPRGETQIVSLVTTPLSDWEMAFPMTAAELDALRLFHMEHNGPLIPFIFYDVREGLFDPTGISTDGKYIGRFDIGWREEFNGPGQLRAIVPIKIHQLS